MFWPFILKNRNYSWQKVSFFSFLFFCNRACSQLFSVLYYKVDKTKTFEYLFFIHYFVRRTIWVMEDRFLWKKQRKRNCRHILRDKHKILFCHLKIHNQHYISSNNGVIWCCFDEHNSQHVENCSIGSFKKILILSIVIILPSPTRTQISDWTARIYHNTVVNMAKFLLKNDKSAFTSSNLEIFSLIWLDLNINNIKENGKKEQQQQLHNVINHLNKFEDEKSCQ
jgi:hypothetical protein